MSPEDHRRVSEAVSAAEAHTSGEIVTIVADRSDAYHDVGLHYAVAAMLLLPAAFAIWPGLFEAKLAFLTNGWVGEPGFGTIFTFLLVAQAVLFLIVRYALAWMPLRLALTPRATKDRRVRRRAIALFKASAEHRTAGRTGVLIYLSMGEHEAEIVADDAIHSKVAPERWGDAMAAMIDHVREGRVAEGMAAAVERVGAILAEHFPRGRENPNELSDRLIEL